MTSYVSLIQFPDNAKSYQALSDLQSASVAPEITAGAIVERAADGSISVPQGDDATLGAGFVGGSVIGMLVGALGGPIGMLLGWSVGGTAGGLYDVNRADTTDSTLLAAAQHIEPGSNAIVLQTEETDESGLDHFVADRGGKISRRPLDDVLSDLEAQDEAAKAAQKAADEKLREQRKAERKEKHDERIANLKSKFGGDDSKAAADS